MVQFASYLRRVLRKTRLIFPRINGPIVFDVFFFRFPEVERMVHADKFIHEQ